MDSKVFYFNYEQEVDRAQNLLENGSNIFVSGPPLSGKSSFLKRIMEKFHRKGECQLINGKSINSYEKMVKTLEKMKTVLENNKQLILFIDDLELISNTRLFCEKLRGLVTNFPKLILFIIGGWKAERYFFQYSAPFFRMFEAISLTNLSSSATSNFLRLFLESELKEKVSINKDLEEYVFEITYGHIGTVSKLMNILSEHFKQLNKKFVVDKGTTEDIIFKNVDKFKNIDNENLNKLSEKQKEIYKALLRLKRVPVKQIAEKMKKSNAVIAKQLSRMVKKLFVIKEGHEYFPRIPIISEYVNKQQVEKFDGYPEEKVDKRGHTHQRLKKDEKEKKTMYIFIPHPYPEAPNFTGRVAEKAMLTDWLTADPEHPLLSLVAIGGMGKSALAWRWLQEEVLEKQLDLDEVVWWSFYEKGMTFDCFIRDFAANLWGDDSPKLKRSISELYNDVYLEFQNKRYLIILDGVERILRAYLGLGSPYMGDKVKEDPNQDFRGCIDPNADSFFQHLSTSINKSKTLLTTRLHPKALDTVDGCLRKDLKSMDKEDAIKFFHSQGIKGTRAEIQAACEPYGYHPLKLRLLSGLILEDKENPGDSSQSKYCEIGDVAPKEHYIMEISYNALDKNKQDFISSLAAFRAPMDYSAIKGMSKFKSKQELDGALTEFVNRGLLFWDKERNKFDLHPIVRSYCYDRLKDKEGVHSQLRDYFVSVPEPEKIESLDDLASVIELYHHTVRAGRYDDALALFWTRLHNAVYYQFGAYNITIELLNALFPNGIENESNISGLRNKSLSSCILANSFSMSGQPFKAVILLQQAVKFDRENNDKENEGIGLGNLARRGLDLGDLKSADANLRRRIEIDTETGEIDRLDLPYSELGRVLSYAGRFKDSARDLDNAMKISQKFNTIQYISVVWSYHSFRVLLMDDPKEALRCAEKALEFAKKWEQKEHRNPRDFIQAHWLLGASHIGIASNHPPPSGLPFLADAEKYLNQAITECRKINLVEFEASILLEIAKLRSLQDKKDDAIKLATEAFEIADRCNYIFQQADIEEFLGTYWLDMGDKDQARKYLENCIEHCTHCWRHNPDLPGDDKFEYIKKNDQWFYKPRYDKASQLLSSF